MEPAARLRSRPAVQLLSVAPRCLLCLAALVAYHVHRGLGLAALSWAAVVSVSTLFTKQHYVVDVVAGVAMAYAADAAFVRGAPRAWLAPQDRRLAPRRALAVPGIFGALVACAWLSYMTR